jgi:hypothetical protein
MTKLQVNVSPEFAAFAESLVEERNKIQNEPRVKGANQLIPMALIAYANTLFVRDIPESITAEASEVLSRKPGPQKKKPLESHDLFDGRPGVWLSNVALATGCAMAICGEHSLPFPGYNKEESAGHAMRMGWGVIPETRPTSNDPNDPGLPGLRFIPPGVDFAPTTKAPAPMALADVGVWVSEESISARSTLVLSDARIVNHNPAVTVPENAFVIPCATLPSKAQYLPDWTEAQKMAHDTAYEEAKKSAVFDSIMFAQIEAYELGWTMRREVRKGKAGILFVPPKVKLTYEIAHGQTVPVSQ